VRRFSKETARGKILKGGIFMLLRRLTGLPTTGWNPFSELERIQRELGLLTRGLMREPTAGVFPLMNLSEDRDHYYLRAELPGIKAGDLEISATADSLTISGERKISEDDENVTFHRREREAGKFSRVITLPGDVDTAKVEANCADGVLTIVLPKAEASKPKQIRVKSS
jgi:HSP20 family protein